MDYLLLFTFDCITRYFLYNRNFEKVYDECYMQLLLDPDVDAEVKCKVILLMSSFLGRIDGKIVNENRAESQETCSRLVMLLMTSIAKDYKVAVIKILKSAMTARVVFPINVTTELEEFNINSAEGLVDAVSIFTSSIRKGKTIEEAIKLIVEEDMKSLDRDTFKIQDVGFRSTCIYMTMSTMSLIGLVGNLWKPPRPRINQRVVIHRVDELKKAIEDDDRKKLEYLYKICASDNIPMSMTIF